MSQLALLTRRVWKISPLVLLIGLLCWSAGTQADSVWVLSSHANEDHGAVVNAFTERLGSQITLRQIDIDAAADALASVTDTTLVVAIGSAAAQLALNTRATQPVLSILVPRQFYQDSPPAGGARSALYINQPFDRQLRLCRLIVPELRELAVLYGPSSVDSDSDLRTAARHAGIDLNSQQVRAGANPNTALDQVLDGSRLLLALPDPDVFTRYTVAGLLLTAYHHNVPVVGFSAAYVKAGALAAVYSTAAQIGRDAAEVTLAARTGTGWTLPSPRHPAYFSVSVNRQVGRSMNMKLPSDTELLQALTDQESKPR